MGDNDRKSRSNSGTGSRSRSTSPTPQSLSQQELQWQIAGENNTDPPCPRPQAEQMGSETQGDGSPEAQLHQFPYKHTGKNAGRKDPAQRCAAEVRKFRETAPYSRSRTMACLGQQIMVPSYTAARLGGKPKAPAGMNSGPGPNAVVPSYANMVNKSNEGESNETAGITPRSNFHLKVIRKDRGSFTREEQWKIQVEACSVMQQAVDNGEAEKVHHNGTRMTEREVKIYCNETSGVTWKAMASRLGFDAFLPGDRTPGHHIWATLPRIFQDVVENISTHFSVGTFGAIKPTQVRLVKKNRGLTNTRIFIFT